MKINRKRLLIKKDSRGWLTELLTQNDVGENFGISLLTVAKKNQTKGDHYHLRKKEWYCVIKGKGKLIFSDRNKKKIKSMVLSEKKLELIEIPIGYFHSITNIGEEDLYLVVYLNEPFTANDPDTYYE